MIVFEIMGIRNSEFRERISKKKLSYSKIPALLKQGGGNITVKKNLFITVYYGVYYGLLRILRTFITEITVLLQGNLLL